MDDDAGIGVPVEEYEALQAKAAQAEEATRRVAALERENAAAKAGLDLADRRTGYFLAGYEGDVTPEAIRAEWEAAGFTPVAQGDAAAHAALSAATAGGDGPGSASFLEELARTTSPEEVMALAERHGRMTTWNRPE